MNSLSQIEMLNLIMMGIIAIIGILALLVVFIVIRMRLKEKQRIEENSSKNKVRIIFCSSVLNDLYYFVLDDSDKLEYLMKMEKKLIQYINSWSLIQ